MTPGIVLRLRGGRNAESRLTLAPARACWPAAAPVAAGVAEKLRHEDAPVADARDFEPNRDAKLEQWVQPEYPAAIPDEPRPVRVKVGLTVDDQGAVADPQVLSGDERFHAAALAAARQGFFETPRPHGEPVGVRVIIPVQFPAS